MTNDSPSLDLARTLRARVGQVHDAVQAAFEAARAGAPLDRPAVERALAATRMLCEEAEAFYPSLPHRGRRRLRGYLAWGRDALRDALDASCHHTVSLASAHRCLRGAEFALTDHVLANRDVPTLTLPGKEARP